MDNEKKDNLTYDFDFDNQVVKKDDSVEMLEVEENNSNSTAEKTEDLNDNETEKLEEVSNDNQDEIEELTDVSQNDEKTESVEKVKTIKILGKEFNYEDFILIVLGLVIIASIFLMPRIMNMFK